MWNDLMIMGTNALKKVEEFRHNTFGTDPNAAKITTAIDSLVGKYSPTGVMEEGGMILGEKIGGKIGLPTGLGGLLVGAVLPGGGETRALKKLKKVQPATKVKMDARDLLVKNNQPPSKGGGLNPSDYRAMNGDVQSGITGQPIRMEGRPDYQAATYGLRPGEYKASGKNESPKNFTPHHRNGIQDTKAFLVGKTGEQATKRREELATGGLFLGNQGANYESIFDGKLSPKKIDSTGINSTDHFDVHKLSKDTRKRMGIKIFKDRSLDTFHGVPIKDLPESQQRALQLQLGWHDELSIDKVQSARYKAMRRATKGLNPTERRKAILETPTLFSNLSTKVE